jgi:hypothetical protein
MSVAFGPKHPGWAVLALSKETGMPLFIVIPTKDEGRRPMKPHDCAASSIYL